MSKSVHIIYNPAAGSAKEKLVFAATERLQDLGMTVSVEETAGPNMASEMAQRAKSDILVAAGGDGTVREVIDGLAGSEKSLAIFPMGTANVLAAEMCLKPGVEAVVNTIRYGVSKPLHLGVANDRHFAVMASIGFDADVVAHVSLPLKKRIGKLAYIIAGIRELIAFQPKTFRVTIDGNRYQCGGAIISNGRYYGGKFVCAPAARVTDARLHVCLLRSSRRLDIVRYGIAFIFGRFPNCRGVKVVEGQTIQIDGTKAAIQADGDIIGYTPTTIASKSYKGPAIVMPV